MAECTRSHSEVISAQRTAETEHSEAQLQDVYHILEGISLPVYGDLKGNSSTLGESDLDNHESDDYSPPEHGENAYGDQYQQRTYRPRRSARARREQRLRAEARSCLRLMRGLVAIDQHRGNALGPIGSCVLQAMCSWKASHDAERSTNCGSSAFVSSTICRHYTRGCCTWGSMCKFSHDIGSRNDTAYDAGKTECREHPANAIVEDEIEDRLRQASSNAQLHRSCSRYDTVYGYDNAGTESGLASSEAHNDSSDDEAKDRNMYYVDTLDSSENFADSEKALETHGHRYHEENECDDIDDIIDVLTALESGEQRNEALAMLPPQLHTEVLDRLGSIEESPLDRDNCTSKRNIDDEPRYGTLIDSQAEGHGPKVHTGNIIEHVENGLQLEATICRDAESSSLNGDPLATPPNPNNCFAHGAANASDSLPPYVHDEGDPDNDVAWRRLQYRYNMNKKVAKIASAESFDGSNVETLLRYICTQEPERQIVLLGSLPYDLIDNPLERSALKSCYSIIQKNGCVEDAINHTLEAYARKCQTMLSILT